MSESAHRAARQGVHSAAAIEEAESLMTAGVEAAATACAGGDQPQDVPDPAPLENRLVASKAATTAP